MDPADASSPAQDPASSAAPPAPSPAVSELRPLLIAMDFMAQDNAPDGTGLQVRPADYPDLTDDEFDAMMDKAYKVAKTLRVLSVHKPCLYRAIKLWAGVA